MSKCHKCNDTGMIGSMGSYLPVECSCQKNIVSDEDLANQFMKKLNAAYTKIGNEVLGD